MGFHDQTGSLQCARHHFSTERLAPAERMAVWREEFGQKFVRLDMEPIADDPLYYEAQFQMLGDASIGMGRLSATSFARTRSLLQDGNDNIVLLIPQTGVIRAQTGPLDKVLQPGDCLVRRSDEIGRTQLRPGGFVTLALPVRGLAERVADIDRLLLTVLPSGGAALDLLTSYCQAVMARSAALTSEMGQVARAHLLDLAAVAIGANRDAWHQAQDRGVRAARHAQALATIRRRAADPDFRMTDLARLMHVSESYIRKILADRGMTFSTLLREARLDQARARLTDPRHRDRQIGLIALDCGFGDISYFNRVFQRRYGQTPSACRATARG